MLPAPAAGGGDSGAGALFSRSFLVALTNPKALLFMSAFLPQFIDPAAALAPQYGALAGGMLVVLAGTVALYRRAG
ncbi:amino acid efflux protein [Bordetella pertussis]|nr:amino acid efflux protein [Bordetella pertussis]